MAESIFNRPMFRNTTPPGPDFAQPIERSYKKPSEDIVSNITIDFKDPKYQQPLGIMDVLSQTQYDFAPEVAKQAYEE